MFRFKKSCSSIFSKAYNKSPNTRISQKLQNCNISSQFKEFVTFRKTKIKPLISIKMHYLIQIVNVSFWTISSCWEFLKKKFLETEWWEAWWRYWGWELVSRGMEAILQIRRLGGHFCGDHGASAPPTSQGTHPPLVFH